jgi:hypothetical protein
MMSQLSIHEFFDFGCPNECDDGVYLFKPAYEWEPWFVWNFILFNNIALTMFVGIIVSKPSQDFTHPLGITRGLIGLMHMLNAIVSHDSGFMFITFIFFCFFFSFYFANRLAKCKFKGIWWVPNIAYLGPLICIY